MPKAFLKVKPKWTVVFLCQTAEDNLLRRKWPLKDTVANINLDYFNHRGGAARTPGEGSIFVPNSSMSPRRAFVTSGGFGRGEAREGYIRRITTRPVIR